MVFLKYEIETDVRAKVLLIHNYPDELDVAFKAQGILVDSVPVPNAPTGKVPSLYINPKTNEMWYEYNDVPLSEQELENMNLKTRISLIEAALDELILGGGV